MAVFTLNYNIGLDFRNTDFEFFTWHHATSDRAQKCSPVNWVVNILFFKRRRIN
jgi:hypothetical protein